VTAVLNLPTNVSPAGPLSASNITPTLTWTDPANSANLTYQLWFADNNWNQVWSIPAINAYTNGLNSAITSIHWGTDPTGAINPAPISSLTSGQVYYYEIKTYDANGNFAQQFVDYVPGFQTLALPAPNPSSLGPATVGQSYSGSITAIGGYDGYTYNVNGTGCWGCSNISLSKGLTITGESGSLTIAGTPTSAGPVTFTVYVNDTTWKNEPSPVTYTINIGTAPVSLPATSSNPLGSALVSSPYNGNINASGGAGGGNYAWTVNGTAVPTTMAYVPIASGGGLTAANSGGNTLWIAGTPASSGSLSLAVTVKNTTNSNDTASVTYNLPVSSGPNGAHNGYLSGTYTCKFEGYNDRDGSRWATLSSFKADGNGKMSSGVWDMNSRSQTTAGSGTVTGTYNVGADNNGLMTTSATQTVGGSGTYPAKWAIAIDNSGGTTATELRMIEADDVGSSPSGQHGTAVCYQATTSAFAPGTLNGHSFAFAMQGEDASGLPEAWAGRFSASSGSITNGMMDGMYIKKTSDGGGPLSGTYTAPNSTTGRFTVTTPVTVAGVLYNATKVVYIIDAKRAFVLMTYGDGGMQVGDVRTQQQTSYSSTNLNGSAVLYSRGYEYSNGNVSGYDTFILQGSSSGTGTFMVNQSYQDSDGIYTPGKENGTAVPIAFDPNYPGRATYSPGGDSSFLYFYDNNSAFELDLNGSDGYLETGSMEPQTQNVFSNTALAGNYLYGRMTPMTEDKSDESGFVQVGSTGAVTGGTSSAGQGNFSWDQPVPSNLNANWLSATYGTFSIPESATESMVCGVITAKKFVCFDNTSTSGTMSVFEQ